MCWVPRCAAILKDGLREAGHVRVEWITDTTNLLVHMTALDPDVVLIDLENPNRDVLEQMFQVQTAYTRDHDGSGLGLTLCHSLMKLHEGLLTINSVRDAGTEVRATFPKARSVEGA